MGADKRGSENKSRRSKNKNKEGRACSNTKLMTYTEEDKTKDKINIGIEI